MRSVPVILAFLVGVELGEAAALSDLASADRRVVVTSNADDGPGTLRMAMEILNAEGDGEIDLRAVSGVISLQSALPEVRRNLRLVGPESPYEPVRLDGQGHCPILAFSRGTACEILRVTLANGLARDGREGAAISNAGALVLVDCELRDNRTLGGRGGAIFNLGQLHLAGVSLRSNRVEGLTAAATGGDPGDGLGGAVFQGSGVLSASNTVFALNLALGGVGRQAYEPPAAGAALGGAIYAATGTVTLFGCRLESNKVTGGSGANSEVLAGSGGRGAGGAIFSESADVRLDVCTFRSNTAVGGAGAGATNGWIGEATGNGGIGEGGALLVTFGRLEMTGCIIVSNVCVGGEGSGGKNGGMGAAAFGGGFCVRGGHVEVRQSLFQENQARGGAQGFGGRRMGGPGSAWGGALVAMGGELTIENGTFTANAVQAADGYDVSLVGYPGPWAGASGGAAIALGSFTKSGLAENLQGRVLFSTITANRAVQALTHVSKPFFLPEVIANGWVSGGGIHNDGGTLILEGVVCAGNLSATNADVSGALLSRRPNLIGDPGTATGLQNHDWIRMDPRLGPLQDNGGPTLTHALLSDSPALDVIGFDGGPPRDQRGVTRPIGAGWDLGAFEAGPRFAGIRIDSAGAALIEWSSVSPANATLEFSTDLRAWMPVNPAPMGDVYLDASHHPAMFYRLRLAWP